MARLLEDGSARLLEDGEERLLENETPGPGNNPPVINVQPVDTSVKKGEDATFTVVASDPDGDPITYQWYELPGDVPVPGATTDTLTITTQMVGSGRQFYCIVDDGVLE